MKKLFALTVLVAGVAVGTVYTSHPDEFRQATEVAGAAALRTWAGI